MKIIIATVAAIALTGCAGLGDNMRRAADAMNHGVARAPDVTVNVQR